MSFKLVKIMHTYKNTNLCVEIPIKVRYAETDRMGVAYHAHYFIWFNVARDELLRKIGIDIDDGEKMGYLMPVIEASCRYKFPARYNDELIIRAVAEYSSVAKLVVHYEIFRKRDKRLICEGKTVNVLMTKTGRILLRIPKEFEDILRRKG